MRMSDPSHDAATAAAGAAAAAAGAIAQPCLLLLLLPLYEWRCLWRAINQGTPCHEIRAFQAARVRDDLETSKMTVT